MRKKSIQIVFLLSCMLLVLPSGSIKSDGKITTDSELMVVNTGTEGIHPIVDGDIIVFSSHSWSDPPMTVFYHDTSTRTTYNTGVLGGHCGVDIPYIAIFSREWLIGDLNGDGDDSDGILSYYNIYTGEHTVVVENLWGLCWPCMDNGKIVYALLEILEGKDLNGDDDMDDTCGFYYDVITGKSTYFADVVSTQIWGNYIVYTKYGELWYFDLALNESIYIGFRSVYPGISLWNWKVDEDIIAFGIHETGPTGTDLNGDGEFHDFFSGYYDMQEGSLKIITEIEGWFDDVSDGRILMETRGSTYMYQLYEIDTGNIVPLESYECYKSSMEGDIIVGNDWSGICIPEPPWPTGIPNVMIYDVTTDKITNTSIIGYLDLDWNRNFNGDIIAIVTFEANIPEDLNGDGDINDYIVRYIIETKPLEATIDIDPDTLNLKSKGRWITAYIELPEGFDVNDIDISSMLLEDVIPAAPHPAEIGDYDGDGIPDLMVKFDRSELEDILTVGDSITLIIKGDLVDGGSFEGSDSIRVICPPRK